jgi:hypothetical protein
MSVSPGLLPEITKAGNLPIQSDRTHGESAGQRVVGDVVDLKGAGRGIAHDHVGFVGTA